VSPSAMSSVSGESSGRTLVPSNKNRTVCNCFPCLSQNASMSFFSWVVLFILKKTSLLLSVTLIFRCSVGAGGASRPGVLESAIARGIKRDGCRKSSCKTQVEPFEKRNIGNQEYLGLRVD